ncbi:MAG TPA: ROK family protein [Cyclobacteriaceae bacterium]|nr:ROK family protein [Cyclobacteriaceae bacterium]
MDIAGIGIDLGGTKCAGALFDSSGKILSRHHAQVAGSGGTEVGEKIAALAQKLLEEGDSNNFTVKGICVSVPGIAYQSTGKVWAPNIPGWEEYPLRPELGKLIGREIPVHIDSDRACSILGEVWAGSAAGCDNAVFLAVGTGIGAGILSGGKIIRGSMGIAGAIGWMALDSEFKTGYEKFGSFEYNASGNGLVRVAGDLLGQKKISSAILTEKNLEARTIFEAYERHDPLAVAVIGNAVIYWGKAVANLVSIFDPEVIIFGGGIFGPGVLLLDSIYREAKRWAQPVSIKKVKLLPSALGADAALFGAGKLSMDPGK